MDFETGVRIFLLGFFARWLVVMFQDGPSSFWPDAWRWFREEWTWSGKSVPRLLSRWIRRIFKYLHR